MSYATLIGPAEAAAHLQDPRWVFVDCRFDIRATDWGEAEHAKSHIRGALYAHLDRDMSGPVIAGVTGRHPLPSPEAIASAFGRLGIGNDSQVVAYDASTGAMTAARLWWLLKWAGHDAAAVMDGGFDTWTSRGLPCGSGTEERPRAEFPLRLRPQMAVDASRVREILDDPAYVVLDARAAERFRGVNETIDPVAGHIRGAFSAPYADNLGEDGCFKSPRELASRFAELMGGRDAGHVVFYCGSGVTAAHDVLALAHAGGGMARLYPGSWSEWITDPGRPTAK